MVDADALIVSDLRRQDSMTPDHRGSDALEADKIYRADPGASRLSSSSTRDTRCLAFHGMTACSAESSQRVEALLGIRIDQTTGALFRARPGRQLLERRRDPARRAHHPQLVVAWRSSSAATPTDHITDCRVGIRFADVTGAGDTVIATFTLARSAASAPRLREAARLATYAPGGIELS